ncbi:MAG: hypothetical protein AAF456_19540, partial [Planctomycetota bacterium]
MIYRLMVVAAIFSFLTLTSSSIVSAVENDGIETGVATSTSRLFSRSLEKAKRGQIDQALELAIQARESKPGDLKAGIRFIETIAEISKCADTDEAVGVLNEGIQAAAELRQMQVCDGSQDPTLGFEYMNSLVSLGKAVRGHQAETTSQLFLAVGDIANNLYSNPYVNPQAIKFLGEPFFNNAVGHALNGDGEQAVGSFRRAIEVGFTQFDRVNDEPAFDALPES